MNASTTDCRPDRIEAFVNGDLSDDELVRLEEHLELCSKCDTQLTERTADHLFWSDTKRFLGSSNLLGTRAQTDHTNRQLNLGQTGGNEGADWNGAGLLDPTDDPEMLGRFGGYEISGVIGSGGMGLVMKGKDVSLDRYVAIKVLNPSYAGQSASRQRFAREAQSAAAVLHDNVIAIYGVDQWNGMPYLVMPYIKGESLQQRIDRTAPMLLEDMLGVSMQIARGLAAAHDQGVIHRDIKPANILMPSSVTRVILTDFGLARTADDASLTRSGVLAGTPQYMSPEQAMGRTIDRRTDLFSLGSVIYAMACGRPPFRSDTPYGVLRKITDNQHRPLRRVREDLPEWYSKIVDRLLQKNPDDRFQSATELAEHLEDCLAHVRQPSTVLLPTLERSAKRTQPRWLIATAAVLLCFALAVYAVTRPGDFPNRLESPDPTGIHQTESAASSDSTARSVVPGWEFDDSRLDRLEHELEALLRDTDAENDSTDTYLGSEP